MSEIIEKGQKFTLSKEGSNPSKVIIGIKWGELPSTKPLNKSGRYYRASGPMKIPMFCDSFAFLLENERICNPKDLVFFGNLTHSSNSVRHMGEYPIDGSDDNEQIVVDLDKIPTQYDGIVFAITINDAKEKGQHWGLVSNIPKTIRVVNADTSEEICCYQPSDDYDGQTTIFLGKLLYCNGEWNFCALGEGIADDWLEYLVSRYGLDMMSDSPNPSSGKSGGCYVATAVYGSYDCPQVWTLRRYRDYTLAETWYGRAFIRTYYAISPTLVKWFGHTNWFKKMWKGKLDRMVSDLNAKGVQDTPYQDRNW